MRVVTLCSLVDRSRAWSSKSNKHTGTDACGHIVLSSVVVKIYFQNKKSFFSIGQSDKVWLRSECREIDFFNVWQENLMLESCGEYFMLDGEIEKVWMIILRIAIKFKVQE